MSDQAKLIAQTILAHLKKSHHLDLLGSIVDTLKNSPEYKNSKNHVVLTSPLGLSEGEEKSIRSYLHKSLGSEYELVKVVEPTLVAGFTLQINDTFIDASLLGKINTVSNILTAKE